MFILFLSALYLTSVALNLYEFETGRRFLSSEDIMRRNQQVDEYRKKRD